MNPPLKPFLVTDLVGLERVKEFFSRVTEFGLDCETNITDSFFDRRIRTIQVGNRNEQYIIDLLHFAQTPANLLAHQGHYGRTEGCRVLFQPVIDTLKPVLESGKWLKLGANIQFDYEVLKWCLGIRSWNFYDVQINEKLIYCGEIGFFEKGVWALDDLTRRWLHLDIDKSHQKSFDMETVLTQEQIDYCALDTRLPLGIRDGQVRKLKAMGLERVSNIENAAIPAFGDMKLNGLLVDVKKWLALVNETREMHLEIVKRLDKQFIPLVGRKEAPDKAHLLALEAEWRNTQDKVDRAAARARYMEAKKAETKYLKEAKTWEGEAAINYGSPSKLLEGLRKAGYTAKQLKSTNDQHLKQVAEHHDWDLSKVFDKDEPLLDQCGIIDLIRLYRETSKVLSTYGEKFLEDNINKNTGRIHSSINQMGAETGRTSSSKPNVQNILNGADWRGCFIARPGYKIITVDYSGCELRILAETSQERIWIDAFNNGWDVHSVGAEMLFGKRWKDAAEDGCAYYARHEACKCKEHKKLRKQIKAINFGLAYGMAAKKLSEDLGISKKAAQELLDTYKATFPTVTKYLEASGKRAVMTLEARTLSGRRRAFKQPDWEDAKRIAMQRAIADGKLPELVTTGDINKVYQAMWGSIEREGKNTPIQGTNADIAKLAMSAGFGVDGEPYMWHRLETDFGALLINFVHDEYVIEVPEENADACMAFVGSCMERAGAEFVKSIKMTYEGHIEDRWVK